MISNSTLWQRIRRRPLESYNKAWLGAIALALVGALIACMLIVKVSGYGYTRYTGQFLQAASLKPGNVVSLAGVPVGEVTATALAGDHVDVGFRIRDDIRLRNDTKAAIKVTTILGSQYLELRNGGTEKLSSRTIDLAHTEVPYDLQQTLNDATNTFGQVDADQIAASAVVFGKQLEGLPPLVPRAMQNLQALSSIIAKRRDQLGTLLASTSTVTGTLHRQQSDIGDLIAQGERLFGEFITRRASIHSMLQSLTLLVGVLTKIVVKDRASVDGLLSSVQKFTDLLAKHDDLFRNLLQVMPVTVRNAANAVGSGNAVDVGLPAGLAIDSWMCAISGRAKQYNMVEYFKDCQ
ncbi:MCE family protein [Mycobacterium sp. CBMA271]|nr:MULTISPECIES: MlaD family protein [unclassified Mycobacteroides]MUM19745.1 mammalian cell entry protein [Mycobacteroides sp. CBMA 326]MUM21099.1 MCE family protein [Mycobacteroides sp. CBMA 271]